MKRKKQQGGASPVRPTSTNQSKNPSSVKRPAKIRKEPQLSPEDRSKYLALQIAQIQEEIHDHGPGSAAYYQEFQDMAPVGKSVSETRRSQLLTRGQSPAKHSRAPKHKRFNRYTDIVAYDSTRVTLGSVFKPEDDDYINANYIAGHGGLEKTYIAAQGYLAHAFVVS